MPNPITVTQAQSMYLQQQFREMYENDAVRSTLEGATIKSLLAKLASGTTFTPTIAEYGMLQSRMEVIDEKVQALPFPVETQLAPTHNKQISKALLSTLKSSH